MQINAIQSGLTLQWELHFPKISDQWLHRRKSTFSKTLDYMLLASYKGRVQAEEWFHRCADCIQVEARRLR